MATLERVFIIGGCGGFGRRFADLFRSHGSTVTTVDVVAGADLKLDVTVDASEVAHELSADLVLLCLDEANTLKVLPAISSFIGATTVVADICSVKSKVCAEAEKHCTQGQYLSIHPMFGPDRDIQGSNAVVVPIRKGGQADAVVQLLNTWGLKVLETDAAEHDAVTAMVQIVPHALLLSFAQMRSSMSVSDELIDAFATPIFKDLDRVSQGLIGENPHLYHNIQSSNPNGLEARTALREAVLSTLETLGEDAPEGMLALFANGKR